MFIVSHTEGLGLYPGPVSFLIEGVLGIFITYKTSWGILPKIVPNHHLVLIIISTLAYTLWIGYIGYRF